MTYSNNPFVPTTYIIPEDAEDKDVMIRNYFTRLAVNNNTKESGQYNAEESSSGQQFYPTASADSSSNFTRRPGFRKVIDFGALPNATTKSVAHGITTNENYTFTRIYGAATDPGSSTITSAIPIPFASPTLNQNISIDVDATNVNITTGIDRTAYTRCYVVLEYIKVL